MAFEFTTLVLLLISCCCLNITHGTVILTTNFNSSVCTNTEAIITCVTESATPVLYWVSNSGNVLFNTGNVPGNMNIAGPFTVTVVAVSGNQITSTASINVTSGFTNGTSIECFDGIGSQVSETATVYIAGVPSPPTNFQTIASTFSSVTLSWSAPLMLGGIVVTAYTITIISPAVTLCPPIQCSLDASTYNTTITDLDYNSQYVFGITTSSCGGVSASSSQTTVLIGKAPDPPINVNICVSLNNNDNKVNLRIEWECPSVNPDIVPPITSYGVSVSSLSMDGDSINGVSIPTDCRCSYSASVPIIQYSDILYSVALSSSNIVGSNETQILIYSSANISSDVVQRTATSALIAVYISWQACDGVLADVMVTYFGSGVLSLSVEIPVTLPLTDRIFIPLYELRSGTNYSYSVSLVSSGGMTLGLESGSSFVTTSNDVITETVCPTIQDTSTVTASQTNNALSEECPNVDTALVIVIAIVSAIAITLFLMFIVTLWCYIQSRKQQQFSINSTNSGSIPLPDRQFPSTVDNFSTNFNQSYGQSPNTNNSTTIMNGNSYTKSSEVYEEINSSKSTIAEISSGHGYSERPRPPASLPPPDTIQSSSNGIYDDPDKKNKAAMNPTKIEIPNPAYGRTKNEVTTTSTEDYLIIKE